MSEERIMSIVSGVGIAGMALFCLIPVGYMIAVSLSGTPDIFSHSASVTGQNYTDVLTSQNLHVLAYLRNSVIISLISAVCAVFIAALAAYAITRMPFPGRMFLLFAVLAMSMFPQISLINYLFKLMTDLGWINTYPALILPYSAWILPLSLWILVSYFAQIPHDLDRAALVDGCTRLQILRRIIFPVAAPGLLATFLLAFIFAFNEFMFALTLTTDFHVRTIPVGIALFQGIHGETPWGQIMAVSAISVVPVIILAVVFQRRIIQGLTRGAVKG
jgi:multiple sugar transport system permease protein